jgi:hypothetical protein
MSVSQFESESDMSEFEPEKFENGEFGRDEFERARFEAELTLAMQRVDAPAGFADRVLAKAAGPESQKAEALKGKVLMMPRRVRAWVGGAVAAVLMAGAFGIQQQHERRERAEEAARAQQQYEQALQITGEALDHVRAQLQQAGVPVGD